MYAEERRVCSAALCMYADVRGVRCMLFDGMLVCDKRGAPTTAVTPLVAMAVAVKSFPTTTVLQKCRSRTYTLYAQSIVDGESIGDFVDEFTLPACTRLIVTLEPGAAWI